MVLDRLAGLIADAEDALAAARLAVAAGDGGADGARAALDLARLAGESGDPGAVTAVIDQAEPADALETVCLVVAQCFAALKADYPSRPEAIAARIAVAARADAAYRVVGAGGPDLIAFVAALAGETVRQLSAIAATRAPMVRVETHLSMPSTVLAWDLYGDPARAGELVRRNQAATPLVMPTAIEAIGG